MDILDKIGDASKKTVKLTGDLAKQTKLKFKMGDKKSDIDEIYLSIGEKVYRKYILDGEVSEEFISECETIDKLAEEVENLRMHILKLKDKIQCQNCYTEISIDFHYCPKCGEETINKDTSQTDTL